MTKSIDGATGGGGVRVVVAIPMFNAAPTIGATLESLRVQEFLDWRCVVVDDGSTDQSASVVRAMMAHEPRVEMIRQDNQGLPEARNAGLERALAIEATHVMLLDADDVLMPRALGVLLETAKETGAAYGGFEFLDASGKSIGRQSQVSAPYVGLAEQLEWYRTMLQVSLWSRDAIGPVRFDPAVRLSEDWLWCTRIALRGVRVKAVERIVAGYRLRPTGMSKNFAKMSMYHQRAIRLLYREARSASGVQTLDERRETRTAMTSALGFATMEALLDPSAGKASALRMLEEAGSPGPGKLHVGDWVQSAVNGVTFGLCLAPEVDGERERSWLRELRRWWTACAEQGWLAYADIETVQRDLARKVIHPDVVAKTMLDEIGAEVGGRATIGVLGLDRLGRRLVRRSVERGWSVVALDGWNDPSEIALLDESERIGVRVVRDAQSLRSGPVPGCWVTGAEGVVLDRAIEIVQRGADDADLRVLRWGSFRERLGRNNEELMRRALRPERAAAG